jgi:hypothetical protein
MSCTHGMAEHRMNPDEAEEIRKEVEVELGAIPTSQGTTFFLMIYDVRYG